jgi:hypothetical protein
MIRRSFERIRRLEYRDNVSRLRPRSVSSVRTSVAESIARVQPGYETDLLYMAGLFAIVLGGVCFTYP